MRARPIETTYFSQNHMEANRSVYNLHVDFAT